MNPVISGRGKAPPSLPAFNDIKETTRMIKLYDTGV